MLPLLVTLVWTCISRPTLKNSLYKQLFREQIILSEISSAASLYFCPGLFEAIQVAAPPSMNFFRNLPTDVKGRWAIYVLVPEKQGCVDFIYIGSGTEMKAGVLARWRVYNNPDKHKDRLPKYLQQALDNGYKIVHKGVLVSCPIPSAANAPRLRLLFVVMEATFCFLFWAMRSNNKDYGMGACCPWPRESFTYRGLCSHNALIEQVSGKIDLSGEQLEALAAEIKESTRLYHSDYYQNLKATDPEKLRVQHADAYASYHTKSHDKEIAKNHRSDAKAKASRKWYCKVCDVQCTSNIQA